MNEFVVPPAAQWYKTNSTDCAPDNTFVYASKYSFVIVKETDGAPDIKVLPSPHSKPLISVGLNAGKWRDPYRYIITAGEDNHIHILDVDDNFSVKYSNTDLEAVKDSLVGAVFAKDERVIAVTTGGCVLTWNIHAQETKLFKNLLTGKVSVTCFAPCPHASWLVAFGLHNGCVIVVNLKKDGKILYRLRGHHQPICMLSWCPVTINVFPRHHNNVVKNKSVLEESEGPPEEDSSSDSKENSKMEISDGTTVSTNLGSEHQNELLDVKDELDNAERKSDCSNRDESLSPEVKSGNEESESTARPDPSEEEEPRNEYLLASSGRDKKVYIWRAGTDGRLQTLLTLPKGGRTKDSVTWTAIRWATPSVLLTGIANGTLLAWTLPRSVDPTKQYKEIHVEHSLVFNISVPFKIWEPFTWRDACNLPIWTIGQEGTLVCYDPEAKKIRLSYSTLSAVVTCVHSGVPDPNQVAFGLRDNSIQIWNASCTPINVLTITKYSKKMKGRVVTLAWHPSLEMILAFGTEEGRIGFIELNHSKVVVLPHFFVSQVYKVEWGPISGNTDRLGLYACAEGKMIVYDIAKADNDPFVIEVPGHPYIYKFSWKPDFSICLLVTKEGALLVLDKSCKMLTVLHLCDKNVLNVLWHPESLSKDKEGSSHYNWFAGNTNKGFLVYNCDIFNDKGEVVNDNSMENLIAVLEGHLKTPVSLAWSPFEPNKIVSTAPDGLAHVWDVAAKTVLATYVDPLIGHNQAVIWSPIDPDLVIIADKIIQVWSVTKNPPNQDLIEERKQVLKMRHDSEKKKEKTKKIPKNCIVPSFPVFGDQEMNLQVESMRRVMNLKQDDSQLDPLDVNRIFGSKDQVLELLSKNFDSHKKFRNHKYCQLISLWRGNMGDCIKDAIKENRVTPAIISLAPMVSPKLWQEACEVYAKKLSEDAESDPFETVTYFLACHKVNDALDYLQENHLYREALALAKARLPENSEVCEKITEEWAAFCRESGNYETAAHCYVALEKYEEAAFVLSKRSNPELLHFATELAEKIENKELLAAILYRINEVTTKQTEKVQDEKQSEGELKKKESDAMEEQESLPELPSRFDAILFQEDVKMVPETAQGDECIN